MENKVLKLGGGGDLPKMYLLPLRVVTLRDGQYNLKRVSM